MRVLLVGLGTLMIVVAIRIEERYHRLHAWLFRDAPKWEGADLFRELKILVPVICLVCITLTIINHMQNRNSTQKSLTRWLATHVFFFGVIEFSLFFRATNLWVLLDFLSFNIFMVASFDFLARAFRRYVLGHLDKDEGKIPDTAPLPVDSCLE